MRKLKILIVEDEELMRELIASVATETVGDCEIFQADTLEKALEIATTQELTTIFVDGSLVPQGNELQTVNLVKKLKQLHPEAHLIAISARSEWNDLLVEAGCLSQLLKGYSNFLPALRAVFKYNRQLLNAA